MILAEVKTNNESPFVTKLFATGLETFRKMSNKRYVAVGRIEILDDVQIIEILRNAVGWKDVENKNYGTKNEQINSAYISYVKE